MGIILVFCKTYINFLPVEAGGIGPMYSERVWPPSKLLAGMLTTSQCCHAFSEGILGLGKSGS